MLQAIRLTELGGRGRPRVRARCVLRVGMSSAFWNAPAASNRPAAAACSSQASVHEAQIQVDRIIYNIFRPKCSRPKQIFRACIPYILYEADYTVKLTPYT